MEIASRTAYTAQIHGEIAARRFHRNNDEVVTLINAPWPSAPRPVCARTFNSANFARLRIAAGEDGSEVSGQETERDADDARILQREGMPGKRDRFAQQDEHDRDSKPKPRPQTAPAVLKRPSKNTLSTITGRFADAATAKARPTRKAAFTLGPR